MAVQTEPLSLVGVARDDEELKERGLEVGRKRSALGIPKSALAKAAHVDRATLNRIEAGKIGRDTSLVVVERALADLDEAMSPLPDDRDDRDGNVVRFVVKGVYGAESLVVEGPVESIAELERSVDRIMRRLRDGEHDS